MNKKILFFTQACFLDSAIEYIRLLSESNYDVHVCIELAPSQLKVNLFNIEADLSQYANKTSFSDVATEWKIEFLAPYFNKCKSVNFFVYNTNSSVSNLLSVTNTIRQHIRNIKPDYIHLDDFSARLAFLMPFLYSWRKKVVINVHDPKPHIGEKEWKRYYSKKLLFKWIGTFITYSQFSAEELRNLLPRNKQVKSIKFLPCTVFRSFSEKKELPAAGITVSFVGRISPYKGVNLLVEAIPEVLKQCPDVRFVVAGKPIPGFMPAYPKDLSITQLTVIEKHLSNAEMATIVGGSQLVVCPYIEATQSGVIMTAHALNCPVLVTNVGGLPEYIIEGQTGMISPTISSQGIADKVISFVKQNKYPEMAKQLKSNDYVLAAQSYNRGTMREIYN